LRRDLNNSSLLCYTDIWLETPEPSVEARSLLSPWYSVIRAYPVYYEVRRTEMAYTVNAGDTVEERDA